LKIEEDHFAANVETGLNPVLSGYDIEEVPISWINRTAEMGSSSFKLLGVGPGYLSALLRTIRAVRIGRHGFIERVGPGERQTSIPDTGLLATSIAKPPQRLKSRAKGQESG
jgi:hypothetical protein